MPGIEASQDMVRVGKVPGQIKEFVIDDTTNTVGKVLELAELDYTGHEIRLNNSPATTDSQVKGGDTVLLLKKIKGN